MLGDTLIGGACKGTRRAFQELCGAVGIIGDILGDSWVLLRVYRGTFGGWGWSWGIIGGIRECIGDVSGGAQKD